ncbi:hypothetical protein BJV78DRAFT_577812 [Lactifluus subvellereus]|nr:hypothetical protein BJV78DRAFT_577812 [Lactifluus subvellereus]
MVFLLRVVQGSEDAASVLVRLARSDLIYSDWMGTLSLAEWQNWNRPRVDIGIIPNNRPQSLRRLLRSLENACYFDGTLDPRIHMEDSVDTITKQMAGNLH